jgi:regulator of sigma E protease
VQGFNDLSAVIGSNPDTPVNLLIDRNGQELELTAIPKLDADAGRPLIGVSLSVPHRENVSFVESFQWGATYTYQNMYAMVSLPAQLIRGTLAPEQSRFIGLKGIYDIMQVSVEQGIEASAAAPVSRPFDWFIPPLELIAALSISLGIFNLFPFPALDGGRIIFILPELIIRRRVPAQFENLVHGLGMTVLLLFMIYINVMDFINPVVIP